MIKKAEHIKDYQIKVYFSDGKMRTFLRKFEGENFIRIGEEPNAKTLKAISVINQGKGKRNKTVDRLMSDLMAD